MLHAGGTSHLSLYIPPSPEPCGSPDGLTQYTGHSSWPATPWSRRSSPESTICKFFWNFQDLFSGHKFFVLNTLIYYFFAREFLGILGSRSGDSSIEIETLR